MYKVYIYFDDRELELKLNEEGVKDLLNKLNESGFHKIVSSYEGPQTIVNWSKVNYIQII